VTAGAVMMSERRSFQRQGREGRECAHQFVIADRARAVAGALLAPAASAFQLRYIISRRKNYVGGNRSQLPNWISTYTKQRNVMKIRHFMRAEADEKW